MIEIPKNTETLIRVNGPYKATNGQMLNAEQVLALYRHLHNPKAWAIAHVITLDGPRHKLALQILVEHNLAVEHNGTYYRPGEVPADEVPSDDAPSGNDETGEPVTKSARPKKKA